MSKLCHLFLFLIVCLLLFLVPNMVKAETVVDLTPIYDVFEERDYDFYVNTSKQGNLKNELDDLKNTLKELSNKDGHNYVIKLSELPVSGDKPHFTVYISDFTDTTYLYSEKVGSGYWIRSNTNVNSVYLSWSVALTPGVFDSLISYIKTNNSLPHQTLGNWTYSSSKFLMTIYGNPATYDSMLYYSTKPVLYTGGSPESYQVGNELISKDTAFISYTDYKLPKITYDNIDEKGPYIRIPVASLFDGASFHDFVTYFRMLENKNYYSFKIELEEEESDLPSFPYSIYINESILDIEDYIEKIGNGSYSSGNGYGGSFTAGGGSFGGGSGGGRFDSCASSVVEHNGTLGDKLYGSLIVSVGCSDLTEKTPADFKTKAIRIYYYADIFEIQDDVINDALEDHWKDLDENDPIGAFLQPFIDLINEKIPAIFQFKNIILTIQNSVNNTLSPDELEPPLLEVDLAGIGINTKVKFDFYFFVKYRDLVFFVIMFASGFVTFAKCLNYTLKIFDS